MTRVNVINPEELHRLHLQGEYKEITRIFGLARKSQFAYLRGKYPVPSEYTLGTGHMKFFVPRLKYICDRYSALANELVRRGYKPNVIPQEELLKGIDSRLYQDYTPTEAAILINKQRIIERMPKGK